MSNQKRKEMVWPSTLFGLFAILPVGVAAVVFFLAMLPWQVSVPFFAYVAWMGFWGWFTRKGGRYHTRWLKSIRGEPEQSSYLDQIGAKSIQLEVNRLESAKTEKLRAQEGGKA